MSDAESEPETGNRDTDTIVSYCVVASTVLLLLVVIEEVEWRGDAGDAQLQVWYGCHVAIYSIATQTNTTHRNADESV